MIPFPENVDRFCVAGDWHQNGEYARRAITWAHKQGAEVVVHTGDFGYNFPQGYINIVEGAAKHFGMIVMFVDGNHENFDWLLAQPTSSDGIRRLSERVWHLPRNYRWNWSGISFHALGGATSVDKDMRTPGASWWPQEAITLHEAYEACEAGHADVMITHDCPDNVKIPGLPSEDYFSKEAMLAAKQHQRILGSIVNVIQPRWLFHGHFHTRYDYARDVDEVRTHVVGLQCDGHEFTDNMVVFNTKELV